MAFLLCALIGMAVPTGCMKPKPPEPTRERPHVTPVSQAADVPPLVLDRSQIKPMYTELLAVDLPAVVQVATAQNVDIRHARQVVEASRGQYESTVGAAFPAIVPTALFERVDGTVRATEGNLVGVGFNTFQASVAIQWIINPGRVINEIVAARKRLAASEQQERAVVLETIRLSVIQYYDLVFAQAQAAAAHQGVAEAEELLRINRLRLETGTGVPADTLRAEARLAQRQQELVSSLNDFYNASIGLAVTLHLDSSVTLAPAIDELPPVHLVRSDLSIDELLEIALTFRPDLESVRTLVEAAAADRDATWWGSFGPQFLVGYQYGGIMGHANNVVPSEGIPGNLIVNPLSPGGSFAGRPVANGLVKEGILRGSRRLGGRDDQTFGFTDQHRASAGVGWRLSVSAFGEMKKAEAVEAQVIIEAERRLDGVRAQVVSAAQASKTNHELIRLARRQVVAAEEALRLTEANLRAGTAMTLDVLQTQDTVTQARLRYADAVVRYNQSQVNLLAALGLIEVEQLVLAMDSGRSGVESMTTTEQ